MKNAAKVAMATAIAIFTAFTCPAHSATTTLHIGYETPRNGSQHKGAEVFKKYVEEKTHGDIHVKLFPNSSLGGAPALINGIRNGTVDLIIVGINNLSGLSKELNVLDIPFIFTNKKEAFYILDGTVGQSLLKGLEGANIKGLAFWDNGFRVMSNDVRPIRKPQDVKGLSFRVPGNPMSAKLFATLGATPVPMSVGELYSALENKAVDGQDHPVNVFTAAKYYDVQRYLTLTNHQYSALFFGMNLKKFSKMSEQYQKIIEDGAKIARDFQRAYVQDSLESHIAECKKYGVEIIDDFDPEPFKDATFEAVSKFYVDLCGDRLIQDINSEIKSMPQ